MSNDARPATTSRARECDSVTNVRVGHRDRHPPGNNRWRPRYRVPVTHKARTLDPRFNRRGPRFGT